MRETCHDKHKQRSYCAWNPSKLGSPYIWTKIEINDNAEKWETVRIKWRQSLCIRIKGWVNSVSGERSDGTLVSSKYHYHSETENSWTKCSDQYYFVYAVVKMGSWRLGFRKKCVRTFSLEDLHWWTKHTVCFTTMTRTVVMKNRILSAENNYNVR